MAPMSSPAEAPVLMAAPDVPLATPPEDVPDAPVTASPEDDPLLGFPETMDDPVDDDPVPPPEAPVAPVWLPLEPGGLVVLSDELQAHAPNSAAKATAAPTGGRAVRTRFMSIFPIQVARTLSLEEPQGEAPFALD